MPAIGDRVTYRGHRGIICYGASFLGEPHWIVQYPNGEAMSGYTQARAPESALSGASGRTWASGATVMVGWGRYREQATVTGIDTTDGRTRYEIELPEEITRRPNDVPPWSWTTGTRTMTVGPEHLDTHDLDG